MKVGEPYEFRFEAWGGKKPYRWSVFDGRLPKGISLNEKTGVIKGTLKKAERRKISIKVKDSSADTVNRRPQSYVARFVLGSVE